ncbi:MAG: hypothetical protein AB8B56_09620 [Crocinitomicaceae bacterium]
MKSISLFLFLQIFSIAHAQSLQGEQEESMANFASILIDYEIHNDKVVAITKKNREYFLYFEDTKGAKLFQSIDIFFATDLEIDCMGNLFLVGLDSAIQLNITDYIERVQTLDIESYKANIQTCRALFEESLVRESLNNSLIYEALDDSIFAEHPVLFTIQIWTDDIARTNTETRNFQSLDARDTRQLDDRNIGFSRPFIGAKRGNIRRTERPGGTAAEISAYQVGDSLWVFQEKTELLFVYDEYGYSDGLNKIDGLEYFEFKLLQDQQTQDVYVISNDASTRVIQKVDKNGKLSEEVRFYKGFSKSYLKISNGYLYFRDSKGTGESIKRIHLSKG